MCDKHRERRMVSLGFTEDKVAEGQHICFIYNDDTERHRVIAQFLESGLLENEKVLYLADVMTPQEMIQSLENLGVDVRTKAHGLQVQDAASTYCPTGVFDGDDMIQATRDFYHQAVDCEGFSGARGAGEMSWCLVEGRAETASLMAYEARLNQLLGEHPYTACCQYDARRFDGNVLMDVLSVHQTAIIRGQLVRNPFFVEPETFMREYEAQRASQA